jgi:hypothetical protein
VRKRACVGRVSRDPGVSNKPFEHVLHHGNTALNLPERKHAILLVLICTGRDLPNSRMVKICRSPKCHPEGKARRAYIFEQDSHKCPIFVEMEEVGGVRV